MSTSNKNSRAGILGGAFNPPHNAHLLLAETAIRELRLDHLIVVPSRDPPHKKIQQVWNEETRLLMARIAFLCIPPEELYNALSGRGFSPGKLARYITLYTRDYMEKRDPRITVSDIEFRGGKKVRYTIDAVKTFLQTRPDWEMSLIIGMDQAAAFKTWKSWKKLSEITQIWVAERPGTDRMETQKKFPFMNFFSFPPTDVSSSVIREKIRNRQRFGRLVPKIIEEFIDLGS